MEEKKKKKSAYKHRCRLEQESFQWSFKDTGEYVQK